MLTSLLAEERMNQGNGGKLNFTWHEMNANSTSRNHRKRAKQTVERSPDGKIAWHTPMTNSNFLSQKLPLQQIASQSYQKTPDPQNHPTIGAQSPSFSMPADSSGKENISQPNGRKRPFVWHNENTGKSPELGGPPTKKRASNHGEITGTQSKKLTSKEQLENMLEVYEGKSNLPFRQTSTAVELTLYMYRSLKSKSFNENMHEYQEFLSLATELLKTLLGHTLEEAYFDKYVRLWKYIGDIGCIVWKTSADKMKLLGDNPTFHGVNGTINKMEWSDYKIFHEKMANFLATSTILRMEDKVSYYYTRIRILNDCFRLTSDIVQQKKLLRQMIEENKKIFQVRKLIQKDEDLESLFNSYDQLHNLESAEIDKIELLKEAVKAAKALKESHDMPDALKDFIDHYIFKYEEILNPKTYVLYRALMSEEEEIENPLNAHSSRRQTSMPISIFLYPPLPAFETKEDTKMLRMFKSF